MDPIMDVKHLKHNQTPSQNNLRPQRQISLKSFHPCDKNGRFSTTSSMERGSLNDVYYTQTHADSIGSSLPDNCLICQKEKKDARDRIALKM
jgi:hypothetical protein